MRTVLLLLLLAALATVAPAGDSIFGSRQQRAQAVHEKFLQEHPGSVPGHLAYAEFLSENGNLRAAIVHWRNAQQLQPRNAATANSLGGAYLRMGARQNRRSSFPARSGSMAGTPLIISTSPTWNSCSGTT
jgi:Flp pilus assembly protein TadD